MLSADGRCKTFDESADGYVGSEACVVLLVDSEMGEERDEGSGEGGGGQPGREEQRADGAQPERAGGRHPEGAEGTPR